MTSFSRLLLGIRGIMWIIATFIIISIVIFIVFYFLSQGKPKQFLDENNTIINNSISEKIFIEVNGTKQGMFIKGKNINNPIILYLHGGMPDYFLTEKYPTGIENNFTIVWWEQRGSGISYSSKESNTKISIDQLVDDTVFVTKYLSKRFNKSKIFLMGHSGGTFTGIIVSHRHPELYNAYIGIAQISDQRKSEKYAVDYMRNKFQELNDSKMVNKLNNIKIGEAGDLPSEYLKIRDVAMHKLGIGTTRDINNVFADILLQSLLFSEYTIYEKYKLWSGKSKAAVSIIWDEIININLTEYYTTFSIPIYFIHGKYDYTCSYELAKMYFKKINTPVKGFYTFNESAHSPLFEEPEKLNEILINDVINLKTILCDKI